MHPFFANSSNIPAFLVKLWKMVVDPSTNHLITWNQNGSSFIITDVEQFSRELLPQYYKHNNSASFIRQLNTYGFKKVINYGKANNSRELEFQHAFFSQDKVELLTNIKRKAKSIEPEISVNPKDILTNLSMLREKQRIMDTTLSQMKKENECLWRELSTVRQRHKAQEQVLHKVIQFLVQIIQRSNQNIHVPRKLARMLQDTSISQENSSQVARIVDSLRNKDSDCIIIPDEASTNSLGAVIHEVTDLESDVSSGTQLSSVMNFNTSILKPLPNGSKNSSVSFDSISNESSTLEPLNILENLHYREPLTSSSTDSKNSGDLSMKFVAIPIEGDPSKLVLVPAQNFTDEEISNLAKDSLCNVIALPQKENYSDTSHISKTKSQHMNNLSNDSLNDEANISNIENNSEIFCTNSFKPSASSSKVVPDDFSSKYHFDDSDLAELLKASKISNISQNSDETSILNTKELVEAVMEEDILNLEPSVESCNNQLAIPGPSSLIKSTKNYHPDFSTLQESMTASSGTDVKTFEQLFSYDPTSFESFTNQFPDDISMNIPSEDIVGNEVVQLTHSNIDDSENQDQFRWLDFFNKECYNLDSDLNDDFYCGPKDQDVLIQPSGVVQPSLDIVKKETMLTTPVINNKNTNNNKRRKVK